MARETIRALQTTPEQLENINPINKQLVQDFLDFLETTDKSPASIKVYQSNLNIFFVWFLERCQNKPFSQLKKRDVLAFQNYLIKQGLSPSRIRVLRSTLSSLSNFIENILDEEEEWEDFRNIINKIPAPTLNQTREKTVLNDEELEVLLTELVKTEKYQVACFVALSAFSGARKAELVQYHVSDFTEETVRNGLYTTHPLRTKGRGVTGKVMSKYALKKEVDKYLALWLEERQRLGIESDWLFVVKKGDTWQQAKTATVDSFMRTCSRLTNRDIYVHSFRHFFVSYLSRSGVPLNVIKDVVGHNDTSTTELYDDNSKEDKFSLYFNQDGIVNLKEEE